MYQTGNTLMLECVFKDFNGNIISPEMSKCKIYNYKKEKIAEYELQLLSENKYVCYHVAGDTGNYFIEFYGEKDGSPILYRKKISVSFE